MSQLVRGGAAAPGPPPAGAESPEASEAASSRPPRVGVSGLATTPSDGSRTVEAPPCRTAAPSPADTPASGADEAEPLFAELCTMLESVRAAIASGVRWPWAELEALITRALAALGRASELFWVANRHAVPVDTDYLAFHQARVSVLAMRLGVTMGLGRRQLVELGLAGALIDVALWRLPSGVIRRLDALSADEHAHFLAHPRTGADLVRRQAPTGSTVAELVLQHHEREQGQGYPQRLPGEAIRLEAKILGLVDTYTGLTSPASLRPGLRPHEAVREIVRSKRESFPALLIKALLTEISVFPPDTLVRLNTGDVGRVVAVNRDHPLRPRVQIHDARGAPQAPAKTVDLSETPFLYITGPAAEGGR